MKQAIRRELLVNQALIFCKSRNDDANNVYYWSIINSCVRTQKKVRFITDIKAMSTNQDIVYFDPIGSVSTGKTYVPAKLWGMQSDILKSQSWTLRADDFIIINRKGSPLPVTEFASAFSDNPISEAEFDLIQKEWEVRKVTSFNEYQNKAGFPVLREIGLE